MCDCANIFSLKLPQNAHPQAAKIPPRIKSTTESSQQPNLTDQIKNRAHNSNTGLIPPHAQPLRDITCGWKNTFSLELPQNAFSQAAQIPTWVISTKPLKHPNLNKLKPARTTERLGQYYPCAPVARNYPRLYKHLLPLTQNAHYQAQVPKWNH